MNLLLVASLALAIITTANAEDALTLKMTPGCFTGPRRGLLSASAKEGAWIQYADENRNLGKRKKTQDAEAVRKAFASIRRTTLSEEEKELLKTLTRGIIGPGRYTLKATIGKETWSMKYFADMLYPGSADAFYKDDEILDEQEKEIRGLFTKVRTIHKVVEILLPNPQAQQGEEADAENAGQ